MISERLSHYRILEKIGAGGMGEVYRAHDEQLDRDVAIKVLSASTLGDPAARPRLLREARAAAALNHPHVCTIYEVGEAEGQAYIAMELIDGQPLDRLVPADGFPVEEVLRYGLQIAAAVAHAHDRGIVHRDLKASNTLVTPQGLAKVLDFGLAKRLAGEAFTEATTESRSALTQAGTLVGTLTHMAPEQLHGKPADARSDVWALGVVLYEMAAGARPFQGQTEFELSSAILNQRPAPLPGKVPPELRAVIERCLEKEPEQRYHAAGEVHAALEAIRTGSVAPWAAWQYRLARRRWFAPAAAVVALAAVLAGLNVGGLRERLWGGAPRIRSLAVLPLENLSGDPDQDYFADGIHEALITDLAKLTGFRRVIARSSVVRYRKTDKPLPRIARELGVDAVITGSVLRSGSRVRVTAQLINAATEENLWADRYERAVRDVLSLQNEIVAAITREVRLQLTPEEQARLTRPRPVNPEAYEAYLKGTFYLNQLTPEGIDKGLALLHEAVTQDPASPLPYAHLAIGYATLGHGPSPPPDAFARARAAALKALELDDSVAEAHEVLAELTMYNDRTWDWPAAERAFRRVMELNPALAPAHAHYGWYLAQFDRWEEALASMRRAQELDPLAPLWPAWQASMYWWSGRYDEAIREARKSLELNPNFPVGLYVLGKAYSGKGMYKEAITAQEKAGALNPDYKWGLGYTYALAGRRDDALRVAAELERKRWNTWGLAHIYAALGDSDEALRWIEAAYEQRHSYIPMMRNNPPFRPLRDNPRFKDLVRRMNLPQ